MKVKSIITAVIALAGVIPARSQNIDPNLFPGRHKADSTSSTDSITPILPTDTISFTLMLPIESETAKVRSANFDFYSGVLLAVKNLGERGITINLDVVDCSNATFSELSPDTDFIIGPIRRKHIESALAHYGDSILVVSPMDPSASKLAEAHPNLVQIPSTNEAAWDACVKWATEDDPQHMHNYIIVHSDKEPECSAYCNNLLTSMGIRATLCNCLPHGEIENWENSASENVLNKVIIASNNEAILNNAVRNLAMDKRDNKVFGGRKLHEYDTIPIEALHQAEVNICCPQYSDYIGESTRDFIREYRALYNASPNHYSLGGYDLTIFLGSTYAELGKGWYDHICDHDQVNLLQSNFKLERKGGLVNVGVKKLTYNRDFSITVR